MHEAPDKPENPPRTNAMKRLLLIAAAALSTLLAGCTIIYTSDRCPVCTSGGGKGDPANPAVFIADGNIQVDQQVLRFAKDQVNVTITWRLLNPGKDGNSGLRFPDNGIVFERSADGEISCTRSADGLVFRCLNKHSKPGIYKYGVNVNENGRALKPLDPIVWNE